MKWRLECQTCKHASCYGYGTCIPCNKDECVYEPYSTTATTQISHKLDWLHHDTQTKG